MEPATASLILIGLMLVILTTGVWIGLALGLVGYLAFAMMTSANPALSFASTIWGSMNSWTLTALPMFIWMGEILVRSSLSDDMFKGLAPWMQRLPGRLLHTNVFGCGIFAAISGSSAATAATIGRMTIPELRKRGYDDFMNIGSLAGSGTLGLLIPPSIIMIVYGVAAEVSIARLFIAGVIPGIALMLIFSGVLLAIGLVPDGSHDGTARLLALADQGRQAPLAHWFAVSAPTIPPSRVARWCAGPVRRNECGRSCRS